MKDTGIYIGAISFASTTRFSLGNIAMFSWWELLFIGFFILAMAIFGGFVGMVIQESKAVKLFIHSLQNLIEKWTGKKKDLKQLT